MKGALILTFVPFLEMVVPRDNPRKNLGLYQTATASYGKPATAPLSDLQGRVVVYDKGNDKKVVATVLDGFFGLVVSPNTAQALAGREKFKNWKVTWQAWALEVHGEVLGSPV